LRIFPEPLINGSGLPPAPVYTGINRPISQSFVCLAANQIQNLFELLEIKVKKSVGPEKQRGARKPAALKHYTYGGFLRHKCLIRIWLGSSQTFLLLDTRLAQSMPAHKTWLEHSHVRPALWQ
jgi:hypothetical protein